MFKSFNDFLTEAKEPRGNYVSIDTTLEDRGLNLGKEGVFTKSPHVTLMYSKNTNKTDSSVNQVVGRFPQQVSATFGGVKIFDDSDGKHAVVLGLVCDELHTMHGELSSAGLVHSYDEYEPHLTYAYNLTRDEAEALKIELEAIYGTELEPKKGQEFVLSGYNVQAVQKNWATS